MGSRPTLHLLTMSRRIPCVLIVILATLLAFHALTIHRQCYFVDEVNELAIAALPVGEIIRARDSMPPLYPLVHKAWRAVWQTDSASRWLSALFHMATVLVVWRIGHKFIDAPTGVVAAALAAICPLLLYYAQFVRAYALYVLLVALLSWCLLRARDTNRWRDWLSFVAVGLAGCYTHYYFPLFLAACALCLMLERRLLINSRAMITFGLIALVAMPLFPLVHDDLSYQRGMRENRALSPTELG